MDEEDCPEGSLLDESYVRIPLLIAYILVFALCLLGNLFTIIVICVHRSMRTATNFFLANLALADLLVATFCILQNMFHILGSQQGTWVLGSTVCKLYVFFLHMVPCTSIGILVCVSAEKYIAVLHPLLALKLLTPKLRLAMSVCIWSLSFLFNAPYYFTAKEMRWGKHSACIRDLDMEFWSLNTKELITLSFLLWYCLPLATICYLYTRIGMVLWTKGGALLNKPCVGSVRYSTSIAAALNDTVNGGTGGDGGDGAAVTISITSPSDGEERLALQRQPSMPMSEAAATTATVVSGGGNGSDVLEARKKIVRLLIAIVCSFATLTLPHHARLLHSMLSNAQQCNATIGTLLQPGAYLLLFLSSCVNPLLYAFMSQRFRSAVKDIVQCDAVRIQRKWTRTRTLQSDVQNELSRSPSMNPLFDVRTDATGGSIHNGHANGKLFSHFLRVADHGTKGNQHSTMSTMAPITRIRIRTSRADRDSQRSSQSSSQSSRHSCLLPSTTARSDGAEGVERRRVATDTTGNGRTETVLEEKRHHSTC